MASERSPFPPSMRACATTPATMAASARSVRRVEASAFSQVYRSPAPRGRSVAFMARSRSSRWSRASRRVPTGHCRARRPISRERSIRSSPA